MVKKEKVLFKKGDIGILLSALVVAGILYLYAGHRVEGEYVYVTVNNHTTAYSLLEDTVIPLYIGTGDYNTIVIENKRVFVKNASCLDQICVHHKEVYKDGETIICLPNQVFIEVESGRQRDIDN